MPLVIWTSRGVDKAQKQEYNQPQICEIIPKTEYAGLGKMKGKKGTRTARQYAVAGALLNFNQIRRTLSLPLKLAVEKEEKITNHVKEYKFYRFQE